MNAERLRGMLRELYGLVGELEAMFPGRHFTPDGYLVGSLGEALAAHHYGFDELFTASYAGHDGRAGGRLVQVKATQKQRVAIRSKPQHLLVLKLDRQGGFTEVYNGPGDRVWALVKREGDAEQRPT